MVDWKRDIKLSDLVGRKSTAEETFGGVATVEEPETKSTPRWKREIRLRKPKIEDAELDITPSEAETATIPLPTELPEPGVAPEPRRRRSLVSRDISFRRRRGPAEDHAPAPRREGKGKKAQVVGLKVGASQLAAAHVVSNGGFELTQLEREPLERGIVVGGELRDPEALAIALKEFFSKNKLPTRGVRLGLGTNRIGVRRFEIAVDDPQLLENAIRFRAQEVLPIPLDEAVIDYQVVGESEDGQGQRTYRVLLVVAYRDLVARYVEACKAAGLKLIGIDFEAFALLRALATEGAPESDAATVVVSIGHDRSTFVVSDGSVCEFARVLDWGGGALDVAIARALDLAPSQAEPVKRALTLNETHERLDGYTEEQAQKVYESVRKELQTFVRELVSSLHFYQNQPGSLGIGEITITGGTAQLPGLAAELQRLIGVAVRVGDPLNRVTPARRIDTSAPMGSFAVAIGLGMES